MITGDKFDVGETIRYYELNIKKLRILKKLYLREMYAAHSQEEILQSPLLSLDKGFLGLRFPLIMIETASLSLCLLFIKQRQVLLRYSLFGEVCIAHPLVYNKLQKLSYSTESKNIMFLLEITGCCKIKSSYFNPFDFITTKPV